MRARSALMMCLSEVIRGQDMTQEQAAALFGVTQPRISDLVRGKVNLFSLDALIDMAAAAGMAPIVKVTTPKALQRKPAITAMAQQDVKRQTRRAAHA